MTSIEFAAKYRLLKNVATRGARSFLAQQVELGRMVMVHYLDSETPEQRSTTLARLEALQDPARKKLLEIADVDGSPVAVTLFLTSFADFTTWLDSVSSVAPPANVASQARPKAGDFTQAFRKSDFPASSRMTAATPDTPKRPEAAPHRSAGEFTSFFGKIEETAASSGTSGERSYAPASPNDADDSPTQIIEPLKAPRAVESKASARPEPAPAPPDPGGFTAIFGKLGETPLSSFSPAGAAPIAKAAVKPSVMPHSPPPPDLSRPSSPPPMAAPAEPPQPGEFTQLFQRMSAAAGAGAGGPSAFGAIPPAPATAPEIPRPIEPMPRADFAVPPVPSLGQPTILPAPSLGASGVAAAASLGSLGAAPFLGGSVPPLSPIAPRPADATSLPNAGRVPGAPALPAGAPAPAWGAPAAGALFGDVGGGQSEFTRILGRVAVAPPPPISIQPPTPNAGPAAAPPGQQSSKSMMPLVIALGTVVLMTIAIVAYFILKK